MPQPPMSEKDLAGTDLLKHKREHVHLTTNPSTFMLNDISVGLVNADVIKDLCLRMVVKQEPNKVGAGGVQVAP